jgi:peptide methionine sulfoxide reductase msrA/msrB
MICILQSKLFKMTFFKSTYLIAISLICITFQSCGQPKNKSKSMDNINFEVQKTDTDWLKQLGEAQFFILRQKGTERPGTGEFLMHKDKGVYICAGCGSELFTDEMKFDSHCGWPSFDKEITGGKIKQISDNTLGMTRTEIVCAKCGGHLGHIFPDGPTETGMRYCVNSLSLGFEPAIKKKEIALDTLTLGGGCFWCIETLFMDLKGVHSVTSGYSGGKIKNVSYKEVCNGNTGHAEVIQVIYDSEIISMKEILKVFFTVHDPTTLNRQGADHGTQYRSAIFYNTDEQKNSALEIIKTLTDAKVYDAPIVTEVSPFINYYKAEDYHQNYYNNNKSQPYCSAVIQPKKEKFEKVFKELLKK